MPCFILLPPETRQRLTAYATDLRAGRTAPGGFLAATQGLAQATLAELTPEALLSALFATKLPCVFAEREVHGNGSDWTQRELGLLGDCSVVAEVTVYDDGRHRAPSVHAEPFAATLIFTPGALLRSDADGIPADWNEVVTADGKLDTAAYQRLYERRLTPGFEEIQRRAAWVGRRAVVTVPGLGCGQFAGPFSGQLGAALQTALIKILRRQAKAWPDIALIYYDPYSECAPYSERFHGVDFRVRPLLRTPGGGKPQLCPPTAYQEAGDDFRSCDLYSLVAWDHVSWPGNDFYAGSRATDDGVKAAATSALHAVTGVEGIYCPEHNAYLPPPPFHTWGELVEARGLTLNPLLNQTEPARSP